MMLRVRKGRPPGLPDGGRTRCWCDERSAAPWSSTVSNIELLEELRAHGDRGELRA